MHVHMSFFHLLWPSWSFSTPRSPATSSYPFTSRPSKDDSYQAACACRSSPSGHHHPSPLSPMCSFISASHHRSPAQEAFKNTVAARATLGPSLRVPEPSPCPITSFRMHGSRAAHYRLMRDDSSHLSIYFYPAPAVLALMPSCNDDPSDVQGISRWKKYKVQTLFLFSHKAARVSSSPCV